MISTKGRYALRVMIDLAMQESEDFIPLKDIAARQNISKKYLEIIAKELVAAKLIEGLSGKHGGYKLTRDVDDYSVGEIIEVMEGTFSPVACLADDAKECHMRAECRTIHMWEEFYKLEHDFFYSKKLSDLCK